MAQENCILCKIVEGKVPSKKIYEDEDTIAILDINGANIGHCFVMPKKHYPILEQVPDELAGKLFWIANAVSTAVFESLKIEGTNIFVSNGVAAGQMVAHFMINIIPRTKEDGIDLTWEPKKLGKEEISSIERRLKEEISKGSVQQQAPKPKKAVSHKEQPKEHHHQRKGEENYLVKQLRRIP